MAAAGVFAAAVVVDGVALGETIAGEEERAMGEGEVALDDGEGALTDCRQDARTSTPKLEMNTKGRR